jgi:hypothetical protein
LVLQKNEKKIKAGDLEMQDGGGGGKERKETDHAEDQGT